MTNGELLALRTRYNFACGYCGTSEIGVGAQLTVDHFQPTSRGGADDEPNWVYACFACNIYKAAFWMAPPGDFLLHPLRDDFALHVLEEDDGTLTALTQRGRLHIERLHLNRPQLAAGRRQAQIERERDHLITQLQTELEQMNQELRELRTQLNRA